MALTTCEDTPLHTLSLVEIDFCKSEPDIAFNPSGDESGIETDQTASPGNLTSGVPNLFIREKGLNLALLSRKIMILSIIKIISF